MSIPLPEIHWLILIQNPHSALMLRCQVFAPHTSVKSCLGRELHGFELWRHYQSGNSLVKLIGPRSQLINLALTEHSFVARKKTLVRSHSIVQSQAHWFLKLLLLRVISLQRLADVLDRLCLPEFQVHKSLISLVFPLLPLALGRLAHHVYVIPVLVLDRELETRLKSRLSLKHWFSFHIPWVVLLGSRVVWLSKENVCARWGFCKLFTDFLFELFQLSFNVLIDESWLEVLVAACVGYVVSILWSFLTVSSKFSIFRLLY